MATGNSFSFGTTTKELGKLLPQVITLHRAQDEAATREARIQIVSVLTVPISDASQPSNSTNFTTPGTVTLFLGQRQSSALQEVRSAALGQPAGVSVLIDRLQKQFSSRQRVSLDESVDQLIAQPVFAALCIGDRTVARNLFVPDEDSLGVFTLPFVGGDIDRTEFRLIEYVKQGYAGGLEAVILKCDPPLTPAERAAISAVGTTPPSGITIDSPCDADLVEVAVMVLLYALLLKQDTPVVNIPDSRIAQIGPEATVRELLQIRREALKFA